MSSADPDLATLCARAGHPRPVPGRAAPGAAPDTHVTPLYQVSVFDFPSIEASIPALAGDGYVYRRNGLPNTDELGRAVADLEGAEHGTATGSGMAAIAAAALALCESGDRVVVQRDAYGGSLAFLQHDLARFGVTVVPADAYDVAAFDAALAGARVALIETVSNPLLRCADVAALAGACRARGATLIVDNTFATPLRDRPLAAGADLVVHSATKFLGGHHDLCAGVVAGSRALVNRVAATATRAGLTCAPFDAWLTVRGIRTLAVRMERAWATAAELAARLREHAAVAEVHSAERCALVSFDVGDLDAADRAVAGLASIPLSPSLGGVVTTVSHPASSSHRAMTVDARRAVGIGDGLVRISVGVEALDDLWADLERGLAAV